MKEKRVRFQAPGVGGRLDRILADRLPEFSRTRLQNLIEQGQVRVDGEPAEKAGARLAGGEQIEVNLPPERANSLEPQLLPLQIVFEDQDVIAINKPAGMVVHPSPGHPGDTLANALLAHLPALEDIGGEQRPGIVHRLDKDTSGLILVAKTESAHSALQRQFKNREVEKTYWALVDGRPPSPEGRVEAAIGRDTRHRQRMSIQPSGKGRHAVTMYTTLETFDAHTLLEVKPETGRTHQIRVHLAFIGCPVVGDRVYGRRKPTLEIDRQFLHAFRLLARIPADAEPRLFEAPLPEDLSLTLNRLRRKSLP